SDAGFHIWGYFFNSLALACGIGLLVHHIKKSGFKYGRQLFGALMVVDLILFVFLSWHTFSTENPPSLPVNSAEPKPAEVVKKSATLPGAPELVSQAALQALADQLKQ